MSWKLSKWVETHSPQRGSALALLRVMASKAAEDGTLWGKNDTLARLLGRSKRTVQRLMDDLEADGAIERIAQYSPDGSGRQINNAYRVVAEAREGDKLSPSPHDKLSPSPATDCHPPRANLTPSGVTNCHPHREIVPRNSPSKNPSKHYGPSAASARAREEAQANLPLIGAVPPPKSPPAGGEEMELLRLDVESLVELTGKPFETCLARVSDGSIRAKDGRPWIPPAIRIDDMNADRVRRCRLDVDLWLSRLRACGAVTGEDVAAAMARADSRRTA